MGNRKTNKKMIKYKESNNQLIEEPKRKNRGEKKSTKEIIQRVFRTKEYVSRLKGPIKFSLLLEQISTKIYYYKISKC